jgi:hypothetical protein
MRAKRRLCAACCAIALPGALCAMPACRRDVDRASGRSAFWAAPARADDGDAPALDVWVPTIASGPAAGLSDNLARISPTERVPPVRVRSARIAAGRGDVESFQIIVRCTAPITSLDVAAAPLTGPAGAAIPETAYEFYREHYTTVTKLAAGSTRGPNPSLGKGTYADGLIPYRTWEGKPFAYAVASGHPTAPRRNHGLWVDLRVPRSPTSEGGPGCGGKACPAGTYAGSLTVTAVAGGTTLTATIAVTMTLWDFELPFRPSLSTGFGDQGSGYLRPADPQTDYRKRLLVRNRIAPQFVGPRFHDSGAKDDLKIRLARYRALGLGSNRIPLFADTLDRTCNIVRPCDHWLGCRAPDYASHFLAAEIEARPPDVTLYAQIGDEQYPSNTRTWCASGEPENNYRVVREWNRAMRANVVHGRRVLTMVNANAGGGLVYNSLDNQPDGATGAAADIYDPLLDYMFRDIEGYRTVRSLGARHWSYTTLLGDTWSPKWMLDWAPINERIFTGFMAQALDLKGVLISQIDSRYADDMWTVDPAGQEDTNFNEALVYPGSFIGYDGPAPSMRLFWVRKGIEDYEYVELLRNRHAYESADSCGPGVSCRSLIEGVGGHVPTRSLARDEGFAWSKDPAALQGVRYTIGQKLNDLARTP